jgi:DNA-directed RNA polymerase I, II, and III subunit RPABC2
MEQPTITPKVKKSSNIQMTVTEKPLPIVKKQLKLKEKGNTEKPVEKPVIEKPVMEKEKVKTNRPHEPEELVVDTSHFENDYRELMLKYNPANNISVPELTDYEIPLIIGKRATQIAYGAIPMIEPLPGMNHINIAEEELRQKKTPYIIKRKIGNYTEYWKISDLSVNF